jgi:phosphatidylglycerophosphate synthase
MNNLTEEKIYYRFRRIRDPFFRPFAKIFALLGFKPEGLGYLGVGLMLLFIYFVRINPIISLCLLAGAMLLDLIDGNLARYLGTGSDRGKFIDVLIDNLNFTLFIVGLVWGNLLAGVVATVLVYFMLLAKILMIIRKNISRDSDWLIRPMAGALPNTIVYLSYLFFVFYCFWGVNYFDIIASGFSLVLIAKVVSEYWTVKNTAFTK